MFFFKCFYLLPFFHPSLGYLPITLMFSQKSKGLQTIHTEIVSDWFSQNKIKKHRGWPSLVWDSSPSVAIEELPTQHAFSSPTRPEKTLVIARKKREVQSRIELREGRLLLAEPKRLSRHKRIHQNVNASKFCQEKSTNKNKTFVPDVINSLEELIWGVLLFNFFLILEWSWIIRL